MHTVVIDYSHYKFFVLLCQLKRCNLLADKINARKLRAIETKKRIYESAVALIKMHGLENLSVDSIVERAGVSKGSFYVHYESKFSLFAEYVSTLDLDYEEYFSTLPQDKKPSELLVLVTEKIADILVNRIGIDLSKIIYEALLKRTIDNALVLSYNRNLYRIYNRIIRQGVRQGEFKEGLEIDSVSNHFVMSFRGMTYEWCIRFPDLDLKKEILKHFDIMLTGIKKPAPQDGTEPE
jgi:AcrR family transcriptional regulator